MWRAYLKTYEAGHAPSHVSALALCCVADELAAQWVHGVGADEARESAQVWAVKLMAEKMERSGQESEVQREYEFLCDLISVHRQNFRIGEAGHVIGHQQWGLIKGDRCWISPTVFKEQMLKEGHRPRSAMRRLHEAKLLITDPPEGGKQRFVRRIHEGRYVELVLPWTLEGMQSHVPGGQ